jgi:hypothetical protein
MEAVGQSPFDPIQKTTPLGSLELQARRPEDILGDQITIPCGRIVEEGGVPPLGELHREAHSRVEEIPHWGVAPGTESGARSPQIASDGTRVLHEIMLPFEPHLLNPPKSEMT